MPTSHLLQIAAGLGLSAIIAWLAYRRAALTKSGALGAVLTGTAIFGFGGLDWGLLLIVFFVSSSLLTRYKAAAKAQVAEQFAKGGPRDLWQALANGGIAALIAVAYGLTGAAHLPLLFAFVGAIAEANADTWATELGVLSRQTPRMITTGKPVVPGTSGGVTWDGIGAAWVAAALIGGLAALFGWLGKIPLNAAVMLLPVGALAGVLGSLVDSLLGATAQGIYYCDACGKETERELHRCGSRTRLVRGWRALNNDWVNLLGTLVGAVVAGVLAACAPIPRPDADLLPPIPAQTPEPADAFDFPLPPEKFGPYLPYVGGPLPVDTRYAAQNPGVGGDGKCFVDRNGDKVPFNQLYHAGEDWFARDARGRVDGHGAAGVPVQAVANGAVTWAQGIGADGYLIVLVHRLPDGSRVWSAYWHVARPVVPVGQAVKRGDRIADVFDRGANSHLHWEIRTFGDGASLFSRGSAGGRGTCNGKRAAVGYTWDDDPSRARPDYWGYRNPTAFVEARRKK